MKLRQARPECGCSSHEAGAALIGALLVARLAHVAVVGEGSEWALRHAHVSQYEVLAREAAGRALQASEATLTSSATHTSY